MDQNLIGEINAIDGTLTQPQIDELTRLSELQLLMVGGGIGDAQV